MNNRPLNGSALTQYMREISRIPLLTREEEIIYGTRAREGDEEARELLIKSNLRFVVSIAKRYPSDRLSLGDLINSGNLGLLEAAERYDTKQGTRFITYAAWWIRLEIIKSLHSTSGVRIPTNLRTNLTGVKKGLSRLCEEGLSPDEAIEVLASGNGKNPVKLRRLLQMYESPISLDYFVHSEDGREALGMKYLKSPYMTSEEEIVKKSLTDELNSVLGKLSVRDAEIIRRRFGLNGCEKETLKKVGERCHLTKERVRQIEKKTLEKLSIRAKALRAYLQ